MSVIRKPMVRGYAIALAALLTAACEGSLGLDANATGRVEISMSRTDDPSAGDTSAAPPQESSVQPDTVASLKVEVTAIEFLQASAADTSDDSSAWTRLSFAAPVEIDLMALPTDSTSALVIASGSVAIGSYSQVRLFVNNPRITFKGAIQLGLGATFQGGVEYQVTIPSSAQTGIKTDASFTVTASSFGGAAADVQLQFDENATIGTLAATGSGSVMLSPVIRCTNN